MPTDPTDPSTPPSTRLYQTGSGPDRGGGGGAIVFVILLVLLLAGGGAYYMYVYKPNAAATLTRATPAPRTRATPSGTPDKNGDPTYGNAERSKYVTQASDVFKTMRQEKLQPFTDAFSAFVTAGGLSAANLTAKDAIAARRDLIGKSLAANDDYTAFIKTQEATFKSELQKTPLVNNDIDYVSSDFAAKAQTDKIVQLRDLQRDSLKSADAILAFLDTTFGSWSVNADKHLVFKKPADSSAFAALQQTYSTQAAAAMKMKADVNANADPAGGGDSVATGTPEGSPAPAAAASATP